MNGTRNEISQIEDLFNQLNKKERLSRMSHIESLLDSGQISNDLSNEEAIYVHTKLHMFNTYKHPILPKGQIKKLHDKVSKMLKLHNSCDSLDS